MIEASLKHGAQFVGTEEPPVEELLPAGETPGLRAYLDKYIWLAKRRLPQLAKGTAAWWLERELNGDIPRPFGTKNASQTDSA